MLQNRPGFRDLCKRHVFERVVVCLQIPVGDSGYHPDNRLAYQLHQIFVDQWNLRRLASLLLPLPPPYSLFLSDQINDCIIAFAVLTLSGKKSSLASSATRTSNSVQSILS